MAGLRLVCRRYPKLKVYIPALKEYRQFEGGILDVDESDPAYEALKDVGTKRPYIDVRKITGELTDGGNAVTTPVKNAAAFVCEVCNPPQTFESEAELAAHTAEFHTAPPILGEDGRDTPATEPKPAPPAVRQGTVTTRGSRSRKGSRGRAKAKP